ncbi:MAG TPA: hypothetical protein VFI28_04540 [Candidatus Limnocylindrales bacterium]|nr:hypothetical protein [Candidatus Limnocylindrales bacterium]
MSDDRSATEETAAETTGAIARRDRAGEPPDEGGLGGGPLRPSERSTYGTDDRHDVETAAAPSSTPGIVVGLVLLAIFLAILAWAVVTGLR